jgi:hypothetical protein
MLRAALFAGALLFAPEAHATTVKLMSLVEKTEACPVVVHGVIERVESRWAVFGARVETVVTLAVIESIKGNYRRGERVVFRQGGGTVEGFTQTAPGLSVFEEGEEVIMFLEPYLETLVPIGIGIGEYEVRNTRAGKYVFHDPKVAAVRYSSEAPMKIEAHPTMQPELLSTFLERIRSYARGDR